MRHKNEAGQALVFTAVGLVVLMGMAGLGIDMGMLRYQKRLQQTAADAGALAGANNLGLGGVTAGAQNATAGDGFTDGVNNVTVAVNNPPTSGPHVSGTPNADKYVEVLVTAVQPTYFMKAVGINSQTITTRAVATNLSGGGPANGCLYTLGPPVAAIEGVNLNGSATLNAPTCGIDDNGDYNTKGNALTVNAGSFGVSGSKNVTGQGGSVTCSVPGPCPAYGMPAAPDPLVNQATPITPPSQPANSTSCPTQGACNVTTSGTMTLQPGTYSSITIGKNSTVTLNPGIYYINGSGGVSFNGSATLTGSGVMFYFTGTASINAVGGGNQGSNIQLSAPTSGPYAGILMYQDPADTNVGGTPNSGPTLGGNNGSFFNGILYFPKDQLTFFGTATSSNCVDGFSAGIVITDSIALSGTPTVCLQGAAGLPPGSDPILHAVLVE